jgi:hypothetical protein
VTVKRPGVLLIEVTLPKPLSKFRRVAVELAWPDMLDLPLSNDELQIDRATVKVVRGPAGDDTLLDAPNSLQDFTWQGLYECDEWISAETFAALVRNDPKVLSVKALQ